MEHLEMWVPGLPDAPLDAACSFLEHSVPTIRQMLEAHAELASIEIVLSHADHAHRAWRLAVVQELAREAAPVRVNAIVGEHESFIKETQAYLREAPGVTGQLFEVERHKWQF